MALTKGDITDDEKKVLIYTLLFGKFKSYKDIEIANVRVNRAVDKLKDDGILKRKGEYFDFDFEKYPQFKQLQEIPDIKEIRSKIIISQEVLKLSKKQLIRLAMPSNKFLDEILSKIKKAGIDLNNILK